MGSPFFQSTGAMRRQIEATRQEIALEEELYRERDNALRAAGCVFDQCTKTWVNDALLSSVLSRVPTERTQSGDKCEGCGSLEFRRHHNKVICSYCRCGRLV